MYLLCALSLALYPILRALPRIGVWLARYAQFVRALFAHLRQRPSAGFPFQRLPLSNSYQQGEKKPLPVSARHMLSADGVRTGQRKSRLISRGESLTLVLLTRRTDDLLNGLSS